jgi:hypothetical protein
MYTDGYERVQLVTPASTPRSPAEPNEKGETGGKSSDILMFSDPNITFYEKTLLLRGALFHAALGIFWFAASAGWATKCFLLLMSEADRARVGYHVYGAFGKFILPAETFFDIWSFALIGPLILEVNLDIVVDALAGNHGLMGTSFKKDIEALGCCGVGADASKAVKYLMVFAYEVLPLLYFSSSESSYFMGGQMGAWLVMLLMIASKLRQGWTRAVPEGSPSLLLLLTPVASLALYFLYALVAGVNDLPGFSILVGWVLLAASSFAFAYVLGGRYPAMIGPAFKIGNVVLMTVLLALTLLARYEFLNEHREDGPIAKLIQEKAESPHAESDACEVPERWEVPENDRYPVCNAKPMGETAQLGVLDFAHLQWASYQTKEEEVKSVIKETFGSMATVENVQDAGITGRTITVYFPEDKIRALVIRGTTLQQDWFRNLALYAEVVVLQLMDSVFSLLNVIPTSYTRMEIGFFSKFVLTEEVITPPYKPIVDYAKELIEKNKDDQLLIIGHSLGGALATIVTGRLRQSVEHSDKVRIRPFVFEAMGVYYSTIGFNLTDLEDLERVLVNVVAKTDPVPMMDLQVGTTQRIQCKDSNPVACHGMIHVACEFWRACGDPRRDYREFCMKGVPAKGPKFTAPIFADDQKSMLPDRCAEKSEEEGKDDKKKALLL